MDFRLLQFYLFCIVTQFTRRLWAVPHHFESWDCVMINTRTWAQYSFFPLAFSVGNHHVSVSDSSFLWPRPGVLSVVFRFHRLFSAQFRSIKTQGWCLSLFSGRSVEKQDSHYAFIINIINQINQKWSFPLVSYWSGLRVQNCQVTQVLTSYLLLQNVWSGFQSKNRNIWEVINEDLLTLSHLSTHFPWNSWLQGRTRSSWRDSKSLIHTTHLQHKYNHRIRYLEYYKNVLL